MASAEFIGVVAGVAGATAGLSFARLADNTRALKERAACLRAARRAANEFYDLAERLLADPELPDRLKDGVYDLTLAVTDKDAGPIVFNALIDWLEKTPEPPRRTSALDSELDELRRTRGDLYDDFLSALRSAIATLMFAYGPDHSKVVVDFEATRNQSIMLALLNRVDRVISDWIASGDRRPTAAEAA